MRKIIAFLVVFCLLFLLAGCATEPYSLLNGQHLAHHFTCIWDDLHQLHVDIDQTVFGIDEVTYELLVIP